MAIHKKKVGGVTVGIKASVRAEYSEATAKRFLEDAIFLYNQAITATDELKVKRFSRLAIIVIPFYLESISKYLFDIFLTENLKKMTIKKETYQKPFEGSE